MIKCKTYFVKKQHLKQCCKLLFSLQLLIGCTSDIDYSFEENNLSIEPRTMVAVSKCVDAYVEVNGYLSYKGTHCWTEYIDIDSGGNIYKDNEYDPGIDNPYGGGSYGSISNPTQFKFNHLENLYSSKSTLNLKEKIALENALTSLQNYADTYMMIINSLKKNNNKITFIINQDTCSKYEAQALYYKTKRTIYFKSIDQISSVNLEEEIIHAVQDLEYYGDLMLSCKKNCEFEAKVLRDLINTLKANLDYAYPLYIPTIGQNTTFTTEYINWITDIINVKRFTNTDIVDFQSLCKSWEGDRGTYISNFNPQLLLYYFGKSPEENSDN